MICKELADSLFSTVTAQIATYRKEEAERIIKMDLELELMQLHSSEGNKVFEGAMTKSRRRPREVDRTGDSGSGATEELFSLENQPQADRLFSSYKHSEDLCFRLLQLCSLRPDTASAALVIEQMEYQKILLRGTDRDDVTWQVGLTPMSLLLALSCNICLMIYSCCALF